MDNANNRNLILGGGFVAVLALFLMGCPGPMPGTDTGTPPDDGGMPRATHRGKRLPHICRKASYSWKVGNKQGIVRG